MEKYARQALSEGIKNAEDIRVSIDSELYRVLNLHYNRNNHIEVRNLHLSSMNTFLLHLLYSSFNLSNNNNISNNQRQLLVTSTELALFIFRCLIGSDGLLSKHWRNSLKQSRQERIWIHPGKNKSTKLSHVWMITFQSTLNLKHFWSNWNKI